MESFFTANFIESTGVFLQSFPFFSAVALAALFVLRGEIAILASVYMATLGYIAWSEFILIGLISIILGDVLLYHIGKMSRKTKLGDFFNKKIKTAQKLEGFLRKNTTKAIFLSKYGLGLGTLVALVSGWSNIDFKKFVKLNSLSIVLWMGIMIMLSFIFVQALGYIGARDTLDVVGLFLGGAVILFFVGEYFMQKLFEKESGVDIDED